MLNKRKFNYQWVIVAASFVLCFTGLGFCSGNKGLFLTAVTEALDISRGAYAVSDSLRYITTAVTNLFFGVLVMKFGTRKLVGLGVGALALSCLVSSLATNVIGIYAGGALLGLGLTFGGTTIVGYIVKRWCKKNQGTILGIVMCANALGTAVSAPFISKIINSDVFGYQTAYRLIALILLVVGVVLVLVFRDAPKAETLPQNKKSKGATWEGITFSQALRKPYFYIACICIFFTGAVLQSVTGVAAAHMEDRGLGDSFIATATSVYALSLAAFKFLTGVMYDKKGLKFTMLVCDGAAVVMIVLLAIVSGSTEGQVIAMAYSVLAGLALPLETIMLPLIAGDLFGEKEFGKMLGIFVSVNTAGYAVGPLVSNICFDAIGTYTPVFFVYGALMVGVTAAFMFALKKAKTTQTQICTQED
ncbi:MAG: MFS transporter [Oscillospiraceae bacterium]|nr:MFS transporter [Oscillospiraceae bacterium]